MISHVAAAALLLVQAQAAAEAPRCMTRAQAADVAAAAMPIVVDALVQRCRAHVPADAFLNTGAVDMVARMRTHGEGRQQAAMEAFRAMSGGELPPNASPAMFGGMVSGILATQLRTPACADVDTLVQSLAPLPPENWGSLAGALLGITATMRPDDAPSPLCPA